MPTKCFLAFFLQLFLCTLSAVADGLPDHPDWVLESNVHLEYLGIDVNSAGDVNGDGFDDVLVGAPYVNLAGDEPQGEAYLIFGSSQGLSIQPDWSAPGETNTSTFGTQVDSAGDVNGDGYDDIVIGDPGFRPAEHGMYEQEFGKLYLYYGASSGPLTEPDWTFEGYRSLLRLGTALSKAADVNGDGFDDLLVGVPEDNEAWLFFGSPTGFGSVPDWVYTNVGQNAGSFGQTISAAGDVNGDGFGDVVIGAPYRLEGLRHLGRVYGFYGSADGLADAPDWESGMPAPSLHEHFGTSLAGAVDVDGDGYDEVVVGTGYCYMKGSCYGRVFVFGGSAEGLSDEPIWSFVYPEPFQHWYIRVSKAGDVNGDGYRDVLLGAVSVIMGISDNGRADVFYGSPNGLSQQPDWTSFGPGGPASFGSAPACAGDVNGDRIDDIVIGEPYRYEDSVLSRAYAYYGRGNGCTIDGIKVAEGEINPENPCLMCTVNTSPTTWSFNDNSVCDDGLYCNGMDFCLAGQCAVHEGNPCPGLCDESIDQCILGNDDDDDNNDDDDPPLGNQENESDNSKDRCGCGF